jgi:hypothetical protein
MAAGCGRRLWPLVVAATVIAQRKGRYHRSRDSVPHPGAAGSRMGRRLTMLKKILPWAILIIVLFYIIRNPTGAADFVHRLGSALASAADAIGRFFTSLVS